MGCELLEKVRNRLEYQLNLNSEELDAFLIEVSYSLRSIMEKLDEAIDEGDFESIIASAHTLKGSLGNLGLEELSMVAKNIESGAQSTTPTHLSCYFMRLKRELACFL